MNILEIKGVSVRLGNHSVLEGINLELKENEFLAVIGPNGGGKTTLLKTILGLVKPREGTVRLFGMAPEKARRKKPGETGYLPQNRFFERGFPVSVLDVVLMGSYGRLGPARRPGRLTIEKALEKLSLTGMADSAGEPFGNLSGGQRQRVLIARSLVTEPGLLLLDEPTSDIDPAAREQFYALVEQLRQKLAFSVVLVSHDIFFLPRHCQRVACLNRRIFVHDSPEKALRAETLRETYGCEVDLLFHGKIPHRVVLEHGENPEG